MNLKRSKKILPYILFSICNVLFFVLPLAANAYSTQTKKEYYANEIANIVKKQNTNNNTFAVNMLDTLKYDTVQSYNSFNIAPITYNNLMYSINPFQLSNGMLTDGMGFYFEGNEQLDANYLLASGIFSNHEDKEEHIFDYYYLNIWNNDANTSFYLDYDNFCYITQNDANVILKNHPEYQGYEDIINKTLIVKYNQNSYSWKISNIVMNKYAFNDGLMKIYDNYILAYGPGAARSLLKDVTLTAYFGSNAFINMRTISILSNYETSKFEVYRKNLSGIDENKISKIEDYLNTLPTLKNIDYLFYLQVMGCAGLLFICLFVLFRKNKELKLLPLSLCYAGSVITTYGVFWIIYKSTNNILYLSHIGVIGYLIMIIVSLAATIGLFVLSKKRKLKNEKI